MRRKPNKAGATGGRGLQVVDTGVMPMITSANDNFSTLMISEQAAGWGKAGDSETAIYLIAT